MAGKKGYNIVADVMARHYEIAKKASDISTLCIINCISSELNQEFEKDNPNFKPDLFRQRCRGNAK